MIKVKNSFEKLKHFVEKQNYKGYDPFDGLNSRVFQALPFINKNRFFRLAWIQLFKRNPVNLRKLVGVKKDFNPKGLGLFLTGYCNLYEANPKPEYLEKINYLTQEIIKLQTKGYSGACWGYNFDWQARAFFQPKYTPTVVATSFIVEALLRTYRITKEENLRDILVSSTQFVLKDLNRTFDKNKNFSFSYSPEDSTQVFNASLLGAKLLAQVYEVTGDKALLVEAKKAVQFVCDRQNKDGSWAYGTLDFHQWIDNFHTGYNLECIHTYKEISGDNSFDKNITIGVAYYVKTFFDEKGRSKYYNNALFPIDIHAPAQLVVTLDKLGMFNEQKVLIDKVLSWTIDNMQDRKGCFYYRKNKFATNKIPYIRWSQGWMFYAMSFYLTHKNNDNV